MCIVIQKISIEFTKREELHLFFGYNVKELAKIAILKINNIRVWTTEDCILKLTI